MIGDMSNSLMMTGEGKTVFSHVGSISIARMKNELEPQSGIKVHIHRSSLA